MQASYFETGRYHAPSNLPRQWPMPAGACDREAGLRAFHGMVERSRYVEELGFDWVSVSEHHYSPRILTPSLPIAAAYIASHVHNIKIALLGPIVPQSNPVLLAEEMAMLDTMAEGRLIVGMLRGTTNEMLTYDLNPEESRERSRRGHGGVVVLLIDLGVPAHGLEVVPPGMGVSRYGALGFRALAASGGPLPRARSPLRDIGTVQHPVARVRLQWTVSSDPRLR